MAEMGNVFAWMHSIAWTCTIALRIAVEHLHMAGHTSALKTLTEHDGPSNSDDELQKDSN